MDQVVYGRLITVSAAKRSYKIYLQQASTSQIKEAIEIMENREGKDKGRIAACKKELKRRSRCDDVESENI